MSNDDSALGPILDRIPTGWGRWIDVDAGWYPLIVATDARLAAVDPGYVVHQIKEKFGTLRYYCVPSEERVSELSDAFEAIIDDAERRSALTCERCGQPGSLHERQSWMKTLCTTCAAAPGFTTVCDTGPTST